MIPNIPQSSPRRPLLAALICAAVALLSFASLAAAEEGPTAEKPRFENHWVVLMELGENAAEIDTTREVELKKAHLRYMNELEKKGDLYLSSGFRVHEDERHRELAFYRGDLERAQVEKMAAGSPIVEAGLWKPFVYRWTTAGGDLSFAAQTQP